MASTIASLDAAANERKARLAQLKSLKRKRPDGGAPSSGADADTAPAPRDEYAADSSVATKFLSGRNYDAEARGPKLGFEHQPSANQATLEQQAEEIEAATRTLAVEEEKADRPIDLFKLQPKKPNWDLKRDVERKLERLNVQTDNAIARIVRERIAAQKKEKGASSTADGEAEEGDGEVGGIKGGELLESVHQREREAADESEGSVEGAEDESE